MGILVGILVLALIVVGWLYWVSFRGSNRITAYLLLVLADENNFRKQRGNLQSLISSTPARDPADLVNKMIYITAQLIAKQDAAKLTTAVAWLLWQAKTVTPSDAANSPSTDG